MHRFCVFEIFVRRAKTELVELFHIAHGAAHIWFLYMHTDRAMPRTVKLSINISLWDHRSPASPRLGGWQWILQAAVGFRQIILISHADILYYNVGNHRNNCKTTFICLYLFVSHTVRSPLFLVQLSTHASPRLFHILTSFVRTSPISMLTNRPRHGPWRGLGDSAFVAGNSMNEIVA